MNPLTIQTTDTKQEVFDKVSDYLKSLSINVSSSDLERPWGGFFVVSEESIPNFIKEFYPDYSLDDLSNGLSLTPKILVVEPDKRLSWQYHNRREEIWSVVSGPVGVITSIDDNESEKEVLNDGAVVSHGNTVRHRLCGLDTYGVVAEFWRHVDQDNPSDESDIVRVSDDFSRN